MQGLGVDNMEQYSAVLKRQKEQLEKAKAYKGKRPTQSMKRSREQLESEFMNIALSTQMQGLMNPGHHTIATTFIGEAYLPCTKPISSLAPITLHELKLETHHRGRVLIVRTFSIPTRMSAIQSAIEDENKDVNRLALQNLPRTAVTEKVLPSGAIVAIKEPYYKITADGGVMIRVDHPSDFLCLESEDALVPARLRFIPGQNKQHKTSIQLKEDGNTAFKRGDWEMAADYYTKALGLCQDAEKDLRHTLYRNRASARLHLGHYEWALDDALNSVIPGDASTGDFKLQNVKAFFRAGRAEYEIGNFAQARLYFQRTLELDANHRETLTELERTMKRIVEQEKGEFDLAAMSMSANNNHVRLDHASFVKNTKIAPAGNRGRGLFAPKDLKRGDLIMVEKAFCVAHENDAGGTLSVMINTNTDRVQFGTHAQRFLMLLDKVAHNPKQASLYLDLFDGGRFTTEEIKFVDGKVVIDAFQVQAIAELNGFGCPAVKSGDQVEEELARASGRGSTGIWLHASYSNHSCLPNANRSFIGDMMVIQANQDIKAGGEIFLAYSSAFDVYSERKKHLDFYGFQCDCNLCKLESKVPANIVKKRARLVGEAKQFISENKQTQVPSTQKVKKAKELVRQLRATYDEKVFSRLPRLDCVQLGLWLARRDGVSPNEKLIDALLVLRDLGYFFELSSSGSGSGWGQVDVSNGFTAEAAVHAAMYAHHALAVNGKDRAAMALLDFAKMSYVLHHGSDDGFDAKYC